MINMIKKYYKTIFTIIVMIVMVYVIIYIDVVLRARSAYLEAEKYMQWHKNPKQKLEYYETKFKKDKSDLEKLLSKGKITKDEYDLKLELLEFKKQKQVEESSLKYAYVWYKTVIDLFTPPESNWVKLSRQKVGPVKELWRKELEAKGYKVEDYMLE